MAKGSFQDKKRRQDELISCLRTQSFWTVKNLGEQLNISQRTLMRDLAELRDAGVPINSDRGRGGGISLNGRWGLGRLQMSNTEVVSLLLALVIAETIHSPILLDNLTSIKHRIAASFPYEQRQRIEQLRARIFVGGNASAHILNTYNQPQNQLMPELSQCFIDQKLIEIEYQSEKREVTRRVIEPQMFMLNWPIWYLLAWDQLRGDVRMFRIDRIKQAHKLKQGFSLRKPQDILKGLEDFFDSL